MDSWRRELSQETQAILARFEASREYDHPDYLAAMEMLYRRNFCRVWPYPEPLAAGMQHMGMPVYHTMWGPNEFTCTGNLLEFDRTDRLGEIDVPTLITVGEFDEVHPSCARTLEDGIPKAELVVFPGGGHVVHLEQHDRYRQVLERFLERVERAS